MHELLFFIEFYGEWYFINILCYEELHSLDVESIYLNRVELSALRIKSHHFFFTFEVEIELCEWTNNRITSNTLKHATSKFRLFERLTDKSKPEHKLLDNCT